MKNKILIALLLVGYLSFCQNVLVTYHVNENTNNPVLSRNLDYNLVIKNEQSLYFNTTDSLEQFKYSKFIDSAKKSGDVVVVKLADNVSAQIKEDLFYKNYQKDSLFYNDYITNKKLVIRENLQLFNWELVPNQDKTILNYNCKKAVSSFRGRKYEAYYTDEIAPYGGPWKFDGLPGLILAVKSTDNYFVLEATKLILNKDKEIIANPYTNQKTMSWQDFKTGYRKLIEKQFLLLKSLSENGEGGSVKIGDKIEDLEIPEMKF